MTTDELLCTALVLAVCGLLLLGFPVAFTLAGVSLAFALGASLFGLFDTSFLIAFPQRIFAVMNNEVLVAVPLFVFMGVMLERSQVAEELLENMGRVFGRARGGLAISVSVVGALMAASTGIVGATVVTMGLLSLPTMMRFNYCPRFSCGTIAASGTLGQIIPPSIVLVLLGDQLSTAYQNAQFDMGIFSPDTVSVNDLFAGSLIPGLLLVGAYILYQLWVAWTQPDRAPSIVADDYVAPAGRELIVLLARTLFAPLALIIAVLGSILGGLASPTEAAAVGAVGAILLAGYKLDAAAARWIIGSVVCFALLVAMTLAVDLRLSREEFSSADRFWISIAGCLTVVMSVGIVRALIAVGRAVVSTSDGGTQSVVMSVGRSTVEVSSMVFTILVGASMFSLVFRGFNGDQIIEELLRAVPGDAVGAVLAVMLVMFVLGFFLDFLEIIFIVVPIVAPVLLQLEINGELISPLWLGVMMAINLQSSFLTPPFGFSLFYLRGVAPDSIKTTDIYRGVLPFVFIQLLAMVGLWFFPQVATWLPGALYGQ